MTDTMTDRSRVAPAGSAAIELQAASIEDLLVDWLNELLYHFEVRNLPAADADVRIVQDEGRWRLTATVHGEPFDAARHPSRVAIKSATCHSLHVEQREGEWRARIVFDV
jgi:SHS2 domain-containing protein